STPLAPCASSTGRLEPPVAPLSRPARPRGAGDPIVLPIYPSPGQQVCPCPQVLGRLRSPSPTEQVHPEGGAFCARGSDLDPPSMRGHDLMGDEEPEPQTS